MHLRQLMFTNYSFGRAKCYTIRIFFKILQKAATVGSYNRDADISALIPEIDGALRCFTVIIELVFRAHLHIQEYLPADNLLNGIPTFIFTSLHLNFADISGFLSQNVNSQWSVQ